MSQGLIIALVIIVIILIIIAIIAGAYNNFVRENNIVKEAFSTMDVYLKKRWDLIPNLVETVKGYAKHEQETLENVVKLRNSAYGSMSTEEKIDVNNQLTQAISRLLMLSENYPDLKANQNFMNLSQELTKIEEDIANSRKYYNGTVRQFNTNIETFPNNILAGMFGFKSKEMFLAADSERENVKVEF